MDDVVMHPATSTEVKSFLAHPSHALILYGQTGMGKMHLARHIAAQLLDVPTAKLSLQAYYREWSPDETGTIKLETAHAIVSYMKLKTTGTRRLRRVVIVEQAHLLTIDGQNALLKLIEEPPADTVILLTAPSEASLLATISSRAQKIYVRIPDKQSLLAVYVNTSYDAAAIDRAYLLSRGLPGLFEALLTADTSHPLVAMITSAKQVLAADSFIRLTMIDSFAQRPQAELLVESLGQIAQTGIAAAAKNQQPVVLRRWHGVLAAVSVAERQLSSSVSPKLALTDLFLHI